MHQIGDVNPQTLRLEVQRKNQDALITRDRLRVDVRAEFYVRVAKTVDAIMVAAQTLGNRTFRPEELTAQLQGKFVDALRAVASVGTSFQAPSFNQLYFPGFGTPTLTPQQNRGGEIGLKYNHGQTRSITLIPVSSSSCDGDSSS